MNKAKLGTLIARHTRHGSSLRRSWWKDPFFVPGTQLRSSSSSSSSSNSNSMRGWESTFAAQALLVTVSPMTMITTWPLVVGAAGTGRSGGFATSTGTRSRSAGSSVGFVSPHNVLFAAPKTTRASRRIIQAESSKPRPREANSDAINTDEEIGLFVNEYATSYHAPVMVDECAEGMLECARGRARLLEKDETINDDEDDDDDDHCLIFIDGTLGGGGHSEALLSRLQPGDVVFGCDVDPAALQTASQRLSRFTQNDPTLPSFVPIQSNFCDLANGGVLYDVQHPITGDLLLQRPPSDDTDTDTDTDDDDDDDDVTGDDEQKQKQKKGAIGVDGILLDLGVSSHQIDTADRGFAFMKDGPLDMRMGAGSAGGLTAADICNVFDVKELSFLMKKYGDEPRANVIARSIAEHRPLSTTGDLMEAALLYMAPTLVRPGGRLVILSYHSMEDRAAKRVLRDGVLEKVRTAPPRDMYGNYIGTPKPWKGVGKRRKATLSETESNSRARSANLRIGERTSE
eukprot:scaffold49071_cov54-Attheya_sp.AAC.6